VGADRFVTEAGALKALLDNQAKDPAEEDREYPE
jgi:hypothetical protein